MFLGLFLLQTPAATAQGSSPHAAPSVRLADEHGAVVDPFQAAAGTKAIAFVFASVSCPISNRYAPELRRIHDAFASRGVAFWLVYPNPAESLQEIRRHLADFSYPMHALRDPQHELVRLAQATMTPEAAVFDAQRLLAYHGRIDDWFAGIGVQRPAPTSHELRDALTAVLAGRAPQPRAQAAVGGCYIADFK